MNLSKFQFLIFYDTIRHYKTLKCSQVLITKFSFPNPKLFHLISENEKNSHKNKTESTCDDYIDV